MSETSETVEAGATDDSRRRSAALLAELPARVADVQQRLAAAARRADRDPSVVLLIAVTKTVAPALIAGAFRLGLTTFGENRVQEAAAKRDDLTLPGARWELIGRLQSNKATRAIALFDRVQSVDSVRLAEVLDRRAAAAGIILPVLLEVNAGHEATKAGFAPDLVCEAARAIAALPHLRCDGLMTVAPLVSQADDVRPIFRQLRALRHELRTTQPTGADGGWRELSMGMSDDFEVAVEEGATIVRVGRALFGDRPPAAQPAG